MTKTSGDPEITWNNGTKKLDIAAGLAPGTYAATLRASNSAGDAALTFTLTVMPTPATTYALTVTGGTGGGNYAPGAVVPIAADAPPAGKVFDKWTSTAGGFADSGNPATAFIMPAGAATVTATYKDAPVTAYALTVNSGTGSGNYAAGAVVTIADAPPAGKVFDKWTATVGGFADSGNPSSTSFMMPASAATVTATYKDAPVNTYTLIVIGGSGSGNYQAGAVVAITADAAPAGKAFDKWTGGTFADAGSPATDFTMPASTAVVIAAYKDAPKPPRPTKYVGLFGRDTKYEPTPWNWFKFIALFGFIWMWFI